MSGDPLCDFCRTPITVGQNYVEYGEGCRHEYFRDCANGTQAELAVANQRITELTHEFDYYVPMLRERITELESARDKLVAGYRTAVEEIAAWFDEGMNKSIAKFIRVKFLNPDAYF